MLVTVYQARPFNFPKALIKKLFAVIARQMPEHDAAEISVALVHNRTIKRLNTRYRRRTTVTDVLSFVARESPHPGVPRSFLGEIIISLPRARAQAQQHGRSAQTEVAFLLVHGFLHLAGFDHIHDSDARRMERRERQLFSHFLKQESQ